MKTELNAEQIKKENYLKVLKLQDERIKDRLNAVLKYEHYLEEVKNNSDEFEEIPDIVARYRTLQLECKNLEDRSRILEEESEKVR